MEARVAAVSTRVSGALGGELDKRFQGLYDHVDQQVGAESITFNCMTQNISEVAR